MLNQLKEGGRCGVVVPEGVLFGSTGAHKELRRRLIENNTVEAVLSLPGGVFNPYSGVKTSVLVFRKGGATEHVMFLHVENDGFKLDANHDQPIEADDLPGLIDAFRDRAARWRQWRDSDPEDDWIENWWFAETGDIRKADLNLSANRHRPQNRARVEHSRSAGDIGGIARDRDGDFARDRRTGGCGAGLLTHFDAASI